MTMLSWYNMLVAIFVIIAQINSGSARISTIHCEAMNKNITSTTKDNLFFKKRIPLVIGHRGNPMKYQENTLAGFKSLLDLNVDGFETDILLTKDKKLVIFHDTNTLKLTGEDRDIREMTYEEIKKLNIKKKLLYGNKVYNYTKTEKIPLLEDLIRQMKDSGLLMILEMKPSDPSNNLDISRETGVAVAKMVKKLGVESQVILSSFDPFKLYHARKEVNELNVCFLFKKKYWDDEKFVNHSMAGLENLDGLKDCIKNVSKLDYGSFVLESTAVVKAIGASALDMDYAIFNNPKYSNDTFQMFKKNYGQMFSYGAWTIYKMKFNEKELADSERVVEMLIENGAGRLYTDNAPRLLKKLGRPIGKNSGLQKLPGILLCLLALAFTFIWLV